MRNSVDASDLFIIAFIAMVFITGAIVVFKFMRGGKRNGK
jgi:hypothetical protein